MFFQAFLFYLYFFDTGSSYPKINYSNVLHIILHMIWIMQCEAYLVNIYI
jgi:hypothetical protein